MKLQRRLERKRRTRRGCVTRQDRIVSGRREGGISGVERYLEYTPRLSQVHFPPGLPGTSITASSMAGSPRSLGMGLGDKGKMRVTPAPTNQFLPGTLFLKQ